MGKISLKDKFALDAQRETAEQRHVIHLFREGKFFRAFNYSAWLLSEYVYVIKSIKVIKIYSTFCISHTI